MHQRIMRNVKGGACSDRPTDPPKSAEPLSIFPLIVLVLQPTNVLFWVTTTTLINIISRHCSQPFSSKQL